MWFKKCECKTTYMGQGINTWWRERVHHNGGVAHLMGHFPPNSWSLCCLILQFCSDMYLMFDNAWLFNRKTSKVYKFCTKLWEVFEANIDAAMRRLGHCCGHRVSGTTLLVINSAHTLYLPCIFLFLFIIVCCYYCFYSAMCVWLCSILIILKCSTAMAKLCVLSQEILLTMLTRTSTILSRILTSCAKTSKYSLGVGGGWDFWPTWVAVFLLLEFFSKNL